MTDRDRRGTDLIPTDAVFYDKAQALTSSLVVAAVFEKQHKNVIRDIEAKVFPHVTEAFGRLNFELISYTDQWNREQRMYAMTKDGFMMLAMGYTGKLAAQIKEAYISEFNRMEAMLRQTALQPQDRLLLQEANQSLEEEFLEAICALLRRGDWYLYPMGAGAARRIREYAKGRPWALGRYDDDYFYIASYFAYDAYYKRAKPPASAGAIYARLAASGLIEPNPKKKYGTPATLWPMSLDGTTRTVLKFRRERVSFPIL